MTAVNITPEFERAFLSSGGGSLIATCGCGVTHFVDESPDYERCEVEQLRAEKAKDPERYVCVSGDYRSIHHSELMGHTYVWGCPCKYAERVEHLLWENRSAIIEYFTDRTKADAARAAADGGALGELAREMRNG